MIRAVLVLVYVLSCGAALACAPGGQAMMGEDGAAPAFVKFEDIPLAAPFTLELAFCDPSVRDVKVDAIMPTHQHGMNYTPEIVRVGTGMFTASSMVFHMPGNWQIIVEAQSDAGLVRYTSDQIAK